MDPPRGLLQSSRFQAVGWVLNNDSGNINLLDLSFVSWSLKNSSGGRKLVRGDSFAGLQRCVGLVDFRLGLINTRGSHRSSHAAGIPAMNRFQNFGDLVLALSDCTDEGSRMPLLGLAAPYSASEAHVLSKLAVLESSMITPRIMPSIQFHVTLPVPAQCLAGDLHAI